jgi:hypothetical protein
MKGSPLPPEDHIARYCGNATLSEDGTVSPSAFRLRKNKDQYLSVKWLEYLKQPNRISEINEARRLFAGGNFKLGSTARIAVLNVGAVCTHVEMQSHFKIRVLHEPSSVDPSHSGIHDTIQDELMISELIAEQVIETHPAVNAH